MTTPTRPTVVTDPSGRSKADFFVAVRSRGMLNAMLEGPAQRFKNMNPGQAVRYEYWPANGDLTLVTAREAFGWRVVDAAELDDGLQEHAQKEGPVRIGDLVLMTAPQDIADAQDEADARAADEDVKLPERAYRESLEENRVQTSSGVEDWAKPTGTITRKRETVAIPNAEGGE